MAIATSPDEMGARKWGTAARGGFQPVPHVLLMKQQELGLDPLDVDVLLNITSFWWFRDQPPFLGTNIIAARAGVNVSNGSESGQEAAGTGLYPPRQMGRREWTDASGHFFDGLIEKLEELTLGDPILRQRVRKAVSREESEDKKVA